MVTNKTMEIVFIANGVKNIKNKTQYQHSKMLVENHSVVIISNDEVAPLVEKESQATHCFSDYSVPPLLFPYWGIIVALLYVLRGYNTIYTTHSPQCLILGTLVALPRVQWVADIWDDPQLGQQIGEYNSDVETGILPENPYSSIFILLSIKMLRYCDVLILSISKEIVMNWPVDIPENKILATTNGVNIEYTRSAVKNVTEKESNDTSSLHVVYVGSVGRVRGLDTLIEATDKLFREDDIDIKLSLIGPITDKDRVWLEREVNKCNLKEAVDICGPLAHKNALRKVAVSDICVNILPQEVKNYTYAFPIKIFEYMTLGKPIISTKTIGISKLLKNGYNSLLLTDNKPEHVANEIQRLSNDSQLRHKIAKNAKEDVEQYDWEPILCEINNTISEL